MAVLLQELLQPDLSFVLHTQNPMDRQALPCTFHAQQSIPMPEFSVMFWTLAPSSAGNDLAGWLGVTVA